MKKIKSVPRVEVRNNDHIAFDFEFANGSKQTFKCGLDSLADFVSRISAATFALGDPSAQMNPEHEIFFEAGNRRVMLRFRYPDKRQLNMVMGAERAKKIGQDLLEAADKSIAPKIQH